MNHLHKAYKANDLSKRMSQKKGEKMNEKIIINMLPQDQSSSTTTGIKLNNKEGRTTQLIILKNISYIIILSYKLDVPTIKPLHTRQQMNSNKIKTPHLFLFDLTFFMCCHQEFHVLNHSNFHYRWLTPAYIFAVFASIDEVPPNSYSTTHYQSPL